MFHHFFNETHPRGQGAISARELEAVIDDLGRDNILLPEEWQRRALSRTLGETDLCLTFDDALKCQYDVALPVLEAMGLRAFWFVYSAVFQGRPEVLEIYRHFRSTAFADMDDFYAEFAIAAQALFPQDYASGLDGFDAQSYLAEYPFYTKGDRQFRYLRDDVLRPQRYQEVMASLMRQKAFDPQAVGAQLWISDDEIRELDRNGHVIGLHSFSHPTRLAELSPQAQRDEYQQNFDHLSATLGKPPTTMSHPCNSYSPQTVSILQDMGITLGFRSNMTPIAGPSMFEFPRQDQANLMAALKAKNPYF
jgi:peptidoglycan/xylan/chitin deacetylase (PgdA/CDA1 family)